MIVPVRPRALVRSSAACAVWLALSAAASAQAVKPTPVPKPSDAKSPAATAPATAAKPADASGAKETPPSKTEPASTAEETIVLSPFEVISDNSGYMATNTASGTRLNSRLEDLASPISVVTKQQLQDMAAVDLNDIFRTETNVEGFYQYTEIGNDRNNIVDTVSNNPEANNRIRGMGQANITAGGMSVSSTVPIDSYNVDSVEINRGANSNIFGIGSTSGTVNLNLASGNLTRDITKFSFMTDNLGRMRETFDLNRVILKNKFAVRVLGSHDKLGFVREPSNSVSKRFMIAARLQPFKTTSIKVSYETYRNAASLPNQLTPREQITAWQAAGAHTWNPNTFTVYDRNNNPLGTYLGTPNGTASNGQIQLNTLYRFRAGPGSFGNGGDSNNVRPLVGYIDGQVAYFTGTHSFTTSAAPNAQGNYTYANTGNQRLADWDPTGVQIYVPEINPTTGQPFGLMFTPFDVFQSGVSGASGKAFYDWESVNLNSVNRADRKSNVSRFEVEQTVFRTPQQQMALQVAGLFEDLENKSWNFIGGGGDGVQAVIYPDINRVLPDGSPNPGYLRPVLRSRQPQIFYRPEHNDTFKAQLAYVLDFTRNEGWSKWLGKHNAVAYGEKRIRRFAQNSLRYRTQMPHLDGLVRPLGGGDSINTRYYLGDANGFNIDAGQASPPTKGVYPYKYWSTDYGPTGTVRFDNAQWRSGDGTLIENFFNGGTNRNEFRTQGAIWQGSLLQDRFIPIIGYRKDRVRFATNKPYLTTYPVGSGVFTDPTDGVFNFNDNYIITNTRTGRNENYGSTRTRGVVVKPLKDLTRFSLLNGISFTYNESDSFEPAGLAIDTYGDIIPDPRGESRDYGVRFSLLDERLWIAFNKYKATIVNSRNGGADVVAQRAIPFDRDPGDADPDNSFGSIGSGNQPDLFDWYYFRIVGDTSVPTGTTTQTPFLNGTGDPVYAAAKGLIGATNAETYQRVTDHVWSLMKYDKEVVRKFTNTPGATRTSTNDVTSQGEELEILYRSRSGNFNFKLTGARKETIDSNLAASLTKYIAERQPVLEAAVWPPVDYPFAGTRESFWLSGSPTNRRDTWTGNVLGTYNPLVANLGKPRTQVRKYSLSGTTSYNLRGLSDNKILKNLRVGGNAGWVSKASIGYGYMTPVRNPVSGAYEIINLDPNKRYYDKARYSASAWAAYDFRMFSGRIKSSIQLNVQNLLEGGRLQATHVRTDGSPWNYRIIDPRVYQLTLNMEL